MNINQIPFKVGCDPEFGLFSESEQRYVPAIGIIPGTKESPFELENGSCQVDGTVLEIGITPATTQNQFVHNIRSVLLQVRDILPQDLTIKCGTYISYEPDILKTIPPEALQVGCDKQYSIIHNGGSDIELREVESRANGSFITLGGHVHVGFCENEDITDKLHLLDCYEIMNTFTRNYRMTWINNQRAGTKNLVRIKPYGVELRAPDSTWLRHETSIRKMFSLCKNSVRHVIDPSVSFQTPRSLSSTMVSNSVVGRAA